MTGLRSFKAGDLVRDRPPVMLPGTWRVAQVHDTDPTCYRLEPWDQEAIIGSVEIQANARERTNRYLTLDVVESLLAKVHAARGRGP